MSNYIGLDVRDLAAGYRHHAQRIADGELERPVRSLLIEFDKDGKPRLTSFGPQNMTAREELALFLEGAGMLAHFGAGINSRASN